MKLYFREVFPLAAGILSGKFIFPLIKEKISPVEKAYRSAK